MEPENTNMSLLQHAVILPTEDLPVLNSKVQTINLAVNKEQSFGEYYGYKDCLKLENKTTRVIISGTCGGRILEYSINGQNAIYLDSKQDGWKYDPTQKPINPCGGRFDIGPEYIIPRHPDLWYGEWKTEKTGNYSIKATSKQDKNTGVQLIREFKLNTESTELTISQEIKNISKNVVYWCHWGRTLVPTNGICIVPLTGASRFPNKYIMYQQNKIDFRPRDPNIIVYKDVIAIIGLPAYPKLGFDSYDGRIFYLTDNNLMLSKKFKTYPDRVYNSISAMTVCVFYGDKFCELEPFGPRETILPGESAVFSETWKLADYPFPKNRNLNESQIRTILNSN